jgi:hypothetical protein
MIISCIPCILSNNASSGGIHYNLLTQQRQWQMRVDLPNQVYAALWILSSATKFTVLSTWAGTLPLVPAFFFIDYNGLHS